MKAGDREFVLVGTAHVSRESAELVRRVIETERPDRVCVELDPQREKALRQRGAWESLDLRRIIKTRQLPALFANLVLASYQKRMGMQLGVTPGAELLEAIVVAEELGVPVDLCDRDLRVTMLRAWRSMGFWQRNRLLASLLTGLVATEELSEETLRELRSRDVLNELLRELATEMPELSRVLIDERDTYLAERIRRAEGRRIVAVVGAGHLEGIVAALEAGVEHDLAPIETIPETLPWGRIVAWTIPTLIVAALVAVAATKGLDVARDSAVFWIVANGVPAALGAVLALAHPLTIVAAFIAAPITSLNPLIGAGYVTAFVQAWVRPPLVRDLQNVGDDAVHLRRWWSNRLLRVVLAFVFPMLGSVIGTWIGGTQIVSRLF